jgi:signal transduction histidine kinase
MKTNLKQKKRILIIKWLMLASLTVVSIFIIRWLLSQWNVQKNVLKDELEFAVNASENEFKDSLLLSTINSLMALDTSKLLSNAKVNINLNIDSASITKIDSNFLSKNNIKSANDTIILSNFETVDSLQETNETTLAFQKIISSLLSSMNSVAGEEKLKNPDFIYLKSAILNRVQIKNALHHPSIKIVDILADKALKHEFKIISYKNADLVFGVQNARSYLLKQLIPEVIFSLFLLTVIILSFYWTLRTLKRQFEFAQHKSNFTNNISHELKTPIATAKVALEALEDYNLIDDKATAQRYIKVARFEIERLNIMVNKFMDYINSDSKKIQVETSHFEVGDIFKQIFQSLEELLKHKILDIDALQMHMPMYGDKIQLFNVYFNLLDNAVKYGGDKLKISSEIENNMLKIQVMDNGEGIRGNQKDKVFEPFFRVVEEGNIHNVKGHGLGLSFAKMIIEAHNGSITITQSTAYNCIFIIKTPIF